MNKPFLILILDRNRYVRLFFKRELEQKGYRVIPAKDGRELLALSLEEVHFDLIVLDPELQDTAGAPLFDTVRKAFPRSPIVLHVLWDDGGQGFQDPAVIACLEKNGNSIIAVQQIILKLIRQRDAFDLRHPARV